MKKTFLTIVFALTVCFGAMSQVSVSIGNTIGYTFPDASYESFSIGDEHFMSLRYYDNEIKQVVFSLLKMDNDGSILSVRPIDVNPGLINDSYFMNSIQSFANKTYALIEHRSKVTGKNILVMRQIETIGLSKDEKEIGFFPFDKILKPGEWDCSVTPDKKHLAIIGKLPREKDLPERFKFFFVDENLNVVKQGDITFPVEEKKLKSLSFMSSNNGDFYFINKEFEKGSYYPVVYKTSISNTVVSKFEVIINVTQKVSDFTTTINSDGNLIIAGYYHEEKNFSVGSDRTIKGTFTYNSSNNEIKTKVFSSPINNLAARGIVLNNSTIFLIGEQYKVSSEVIPTQPRTSPQYKYTYENKNILITGFDDKLNHKFDIVVNKDWTSVNSNIECGVGFGIMNEKLSLVYNDQYGKYFQTTTYNQSKLPVVVQISNEGLMDQPISFTNEFSYSNPICTLMPSIFLNQNNIMIVLAKYGGSLRGVKFQVK